MFRLPHHASLRPDDPVAHLIYAGLGLVLSQQERIMADLSKLTNDISALTTAVQNVGTDLQGLRGQIADLKAQIGAGNPVTQEQIDALDSTVAAAVSNLTTQVAQDQTAGTAAPATTGSPSS